jgi:hypothetical protein
MARNYFVFMYSAMTPDSEVTDLNYTPRNTKPKAENIFFPIVSFCHGTA